MTLHAPFLALLAFLAGCSLSVQAAVNVELARGIGSPLTAVAISFVVGAIVLVVATFLARQPLPTAKAVEIVPGYAWVGGGMLGAFIIFSVLYLAPRLGIAVVISTAIAGQLIAALVLDHYGLLGTVVREATLGRIAGVFVMLAGVLMIRFL
jgi:bacterial/archaeal transporter family-2 protein